MFCVYYVGKNSNWGHKIVYASSPKQAAIELMESEADAYPGEVGVCIFNVKRWRFQLQKDAAGNYDVREIS